jgi:hypothetical protein
MPMSNKYVIDDSLIVNFVCPPDSTHIELLTPRFEAFIATAYALGARATGFATASIKS